jgi:hypothetical protein
MDWFLSGGWIMWFLALSGALTLAACARFARRPDRAQVAGIAALRSALSWGVVTGVAADLAAVGTKIPENPRWAHSPDLPLLVLHGIAESLAPAILGGALLSVSALLLAAGHSKLRSTSAAP